MVLVVGEGSSEDMAKGPRRKPRHLASRRPRLVGRPRVHWCLAVGERAGPCALVVGGGRPRVLGRRPRLVGQPRVRWCLTMGERAGPCALVAGGGRPCVLGRRPRLVGRPHVRWCLTVGERLRRSRMRGRDGVGGEGFAWMADGWTKKIVAPKNCPLFSLFSCMYF